MGLVVFRLGFENVLEGGPALSGPARARLAEAGLDLSKPLLPGYPPEVWARFLAVVAEDRHPGAHPEQAQAELGRAAFQSFTRGLVGAAVGQLMRAVGPKRTLQRVDRFMKNGQSEMSLRFADLGPTEAEVTLGPLLGTPHYFRGMLEGGSALLGLRDVRVTLARAEGEGAAFHLRWA